MNPDVLSFMGVMGTIAGFILAMTLVRGLSQRMGVSGRKWGGCSCLEGDHEDLAELGDRIADLELSARRMEELEERLDFAERLLADAPQGDRLVESTEQTDTLR
jgi:hypothetical protein